MTAMRSRWFLALVVPVLSAIGCATEENLVGTGPSATAAGVLLPPALLVPSRLAPSAALDRARVKLVAAGFEFDVPLASGALALAARPADPSRCFGTNEIVAVSAEDQPRLTMLHLVCVTQMLTEPTTSGGQCGHAETPGCPERGDKALAQIAIDAVSTL